MTTGIYGDRRPFYPVKVDNISGHVSGVGFSLNPLNWVIRSSDGQSVAVLNAEGAALDARLKAMNDAKFAADQDAAWYAKAEANRRAGVIDATDEVTTSFIEGAGEGLANVKAAVRDVTNSTVFGVLGFVPPVVWVGLAVYAAWSLGLFHAGVRVARRKVASIQ